MDLKLFAAVVAEGIQKRLGEDFNISVLTTLKNNSTEYTGISFQKITEKISPTIYIDDVYEEYLENEITISDAVEELIDRYESSMKAMADLHTLSIDYENCRDKIIYRLVSREQNKKLLENMPYIPFLDMAITFHLVVSISEHYMQSLKISRELQENWGVSVEQLYKMAKENTERLLPPEVSGLRQRVEKYMTLETAGKQMGEGDLTKSEKIDMIVISNKLGINGAAVVLYEGLIEKIAENYNSDLFLLPSSIHEMIVVPAYDRKLHEVFTGIVGCINEKYVEREEILSDRVYIYLKDEKKFI